MSPIIKGTSDHAPVVLTISEKKRTGGSDPDPDPKLRPETYMHPDFPSLLNKQREADPLLGEYNAIEHIHAMIRYMFEVQSILRRKKDIVVATDAGHKLGITHAVLAAINADRYKPANVRHLRKCNPDLKKIFMRRFPEIGRPYWWYNRRVLDDYLAELIRLDVDDGIRDLRKVNSLAPEFLVHKATILDKLRSLKPAANVAITRVHVNGEFYSDPNDIANGVHAHLGAMFTGNPCPEGAADEALEEFEGRFADQPWEITRRHVHEAILQPNKSHPGPGGVPFAAFRRCIELSGEILYNAITALLSADPPDIGPELRECFLFLLPKSADGIAPDGTPSFSPKKVRPIIVSPSVMRIISQAILRVLSPHAQGFVDVDQKGFLAGRQGMHNVYKANEHMTGHRNNIDSAILFVDFSNAFSCLNWGYIRKALTKFGMPPNWVNLMVDMLRTTVTLKFQDIVIQDFIEILAGCRQGDPCSGLLFAILIEPLLAALRKQFPALAYADDIAILIAGLTYIRFCRVCTLFRILI